MDANGGGSPAAQPTHIEEAPIFPGASLPVSGLFFDFQRSETKELIDSLLAVNSLAYAYGYV